MRSIAVYRNMEKATRDADVRNDALKSIVVELDRLAVEGEDLSDAQLHSKIRSTVANGRSTLTYGRRGRAAERGLNGVTGSTRCVPPRE